MQQILYPSTCVSIIAFIVIALPGCVQQPTDPPPNSDTLRVSPRRLVLFTGDTARFSTSIDGTGRALGWRVVDGPGTIGDDGLFTAPITITSDSAITTVEAETTADPVVRGRARITILADASERICFERDVRPIIRSTCAAAGCHDPGTKEHGYDFTQDYFIQRAVTPGEPSISLMHEVITEEEEMHRMPPFPRARLSSESIDAITRWIEQGALLSRCPPPGEQPCDTSDISYSTDIRPIMLGNCTACHEGPSADNRDVDLSNFAGVKAVAESGQLLGSVVHSPGYSPMPSSTSKLLDCELLKIEHWINAGAPNN